MGQYYTVANLDKQQALKPTFFQSAKLMEIVGSSYGVAGALTALLAVGNGCGGGDIASKSKIFGSWAGDRIAVIGDYADESDGFDRAEIREYRDVSEQALLAMIDDPEIADVWRDCCQLCQKIYPVSSFKSLCGFATPKVLKKLYPDKHEKKGEKDENYRLGREKRDRQNTRDRVVQTYLNFFEKRGHRVLEPSPLVSPKPDLLFTIAGMVQFEEQLSGKKDAGSTRVTTCQRCVRTDDIGRVGETPRHLTGFEMLGNFSFGDYGRAEAVTWAWELMEKFQIRPDRLVVTVHPDDRQTYGLWRRYLPHSRIVKLDSNVWRSGNGTGGLCTEMFYDFHPELGTRNIDLDSDRFVEFYNIVFVGDRSVDSGLGVERLCWILDGTPTVYDTGCFDISQVSPVVRDGKRTSNWLLEEVLPSNKRHGYVLRRLMRRCFSNGYVPSDSDQPEWKSEYNRYRRCLDRGRTLLSKMSRPTDADLEKLWDTHGVPVEVSRQILQNR